MKDRLRSMRRVLAVQEQVKRLAEWQLTSAETRQRELEGEAQELDGYIARSAIGDPLSNAAMGQRRRVAGQEVVNTEAVVRERQAVTQARSLHRLAERMLDTLATDDERLRERRALERLIEELCGREADPDASLP